MLMSVGPRLSLDSIAWAYYETALTSLYAEHDLQNQHLNRLRGQIRDHGA
jgi:hypothetical protein